MSFDRKAKWGRGVAKIDLTLRRPGSQLTLDAGKLDSESIRLVDGAALDFTYDGGDAGDGPAVRLGRGYAAGETLGLRIAHRTNWSNESEPNNLAGSKMAKGRCESAWKVERQDSRLGNRNRSPLVVGRAT